MGWKPRAVHEEKGRSLNGMHVPFLDLKSQHALLKNEILQTWEGILDSAGFIGGRHVEEFEEEFAAACGVRHCASVGSGTDAIRLVLLAMGLKPGDEVITVPNTFIATTEAISQAGGEIVFVDVDPETYNIDPSRVEAAVTPRTKGIVPVHLYGQCADMDPIMEIASRHGLWVVEDAAQAHFAGYKGRRAGSMGVAGAFSFYPGKNLGACGEAGAVTTDDDALAEKVRMLRDHGQARKYYHRMEGYNGRCDALQAAALGVKLKHLQDWNEARRRNAAYYYELLGDVDGVVLPGVLESCLSVFHLFVVLVEERDRVAEALKEKGVATGMHYPIPLHLQEAYAWKGHKRGDFPVAEKCAERLLSLPMYPGLTESQINHVCESLRTVVA
jgi:dTDP-4-amino-4,6-dideoxygalactose transaminase